MVQLDLDTGQEVQQPAISPDGTRVAFVAHDAKGQHLATRRLDQARIGALPETEGAMRPFFSPDGRSVGFFGGGKLKRLALDGGAPVVLADAEYPGGGMWGDDGTITAVLGQWTTSIVYRIPSVGGLPQPWTARDPNGEQHAAPHLLPGGQGLVFTSRGWNAGYRYTLRVALPGKQDSTERLQEASGARYLDGHLVFYRQGKLFAAPFDS